MAAGLPGRALRAAQVLRREGARQVGKRLVRSAYQRIGAVELEYPLLPGDLADSATLAHVDSAPRRAKGSQLTIAWLMAPPSGGSGGHTTIFRMIEGLEAAGHRCVVLLYDRYRGDVEPQIATIRQHWPAVKADIRSVDEGFAGLDAVVATAWSTAHVLATRCKTALHRFYFIQDYEPFFYAKGSNYAFAEDSYRFGFGSISIGHMPASLLKSELGVDADVAEFGCDTDVYKLTNSGSRRGVVFYTKPDVPRRGYQLGLAALEEFHRRHPEQPIHLFGDAAPDLPFPAVQHGRVSPAQLNELYNETIAGLAISFTNISLVPEEMLAAGAIPVANDSAYARAGLDNPFTVWAPPVPGAMADALCALVESADIPAHAVSASQSVRTGIWKPAQAKVVEVLEREMYA